MEWQISIDRLPAANHPARVSIPLPAQTDAAAFSLTGPSGEQIAAQSRTLVWWPDGSPRWVQLDFQAPARGSYIVHNAACDRAPALPVSCQRDGDALFTFGVGRLQLQVAPQEAQPVRCLTWDGQPVSADGWAFVVTTADGREHPLQAGCASEVQLSAHGPHRCQLSWETQHQGALLRVRFRLELLAGIEGFRLSYQFFHKQPQTPTLGIASIVASVSCPGLAGDATVMQEHYGDLGLRRPARVKESVTIDLDGTRFSPYVSDPATIGDTHPYPAFLAGVNQDVGSAVALAGEPGTMVFVMQDFVCQRPKRLTVGPGRIELGIWPAAAGVLQLPQGRSKQQSLCCRWLAPGDPQLAALLANPAAVEMVPAVAWLDRADSVHAGRTWVQPGLFQGDEPSAAIFSNLLQEATKRWQTVAQMFDYGDVPCTGYSVSYPGTGRTPGGRDDYVFTPDRGLHGLFELPSQQPPVWTNNEYDAIYCLAVEAIRCRNVDAWRKMIAAARHQIEVDFVHYADHWQQHRSTPQHSYDHTSLMSSIASHQWTQGLYYYYVLTGDDDVPEIVRAICDFDLKILANDEIAFALFFNRELGWALQALVFGYEMTADEEYLEMSRRIIDKLRQDAKRTDFAEAERQSDSTVGLNATGIGLGFNVNTIPMGLMSFCQVTGDAASEALLLEWVSFGLTNFNDPQSGVKLSELFPETLCYAVELANKPEWLTQSLWQLGLCFRGFNSLGWLDPLGTPLTTKQYTRLYRALVQLFSACCRHGLLPQLEASLLGGLPPPPSDR